MRERSARSVLRTSEISEENGVLVRSQECYAIESPGKEELSKFPAIFRTLGHLCRVNLFLFHLGTAASSGWNSRGDCNKNTGDARSPAGYRNARQNILSSEK